MKNQKNISKFSTLALSTVFLTGCYTQLATSNVVEVERHKIVYHETHEGDMIELDSVKTEDEQTTVIVNEYHYWAYDPLFDLDPFAPDYRINIYYYNRRPHYGYYVYDPFAWQHFPVYYDPWWSENYWYAHYGLLI